MSHLTLEALSRLLDEPPEAGEALHLELCADCRAELAALQADAAALAALPDLLPPPPESWTALERKLREEQLIRGGRPTRRAAGAWLRRAAALALFVLGGASGFTLRARLQPESAVMAAAAATASPSGALREAEAAYLAALEQYAEAVGADGSGDPVARLATLEEIVRTTRAALSAAPADPVINGYHLTALAQREAAMRQIALVSNPLWY